MGGPGSGPTKGGGSGKSDVIVKQGKGETAEYRIMSKKGDRLSDMSFTSEREAKKHMAKQSASKSKGSSSGASGASKGTGRGPRLA